jgi:hypothetical protein
MKIKYSVLYLDQKKIKIVFYINTIEMIKDYLICWDVYFWSKKCWDVYSNLGLYMDWTNLIDPVKVKPF